MDRIDTWIMFTNGHLKSIYVFTLVSEKRLVFRKFRTQAIWSPVLMLWFDATHQWKAQKPCISLTTTAIGTYCVQTLKLTVDEFRVVERFIFALSGAIISSSEMNIRGRWQTHLLSFCRIWSGIKFDK